MLMAFPIMQDGQILFSEGAPAFSENCCCGYYRVRYGECCPGSGVMDPETEQIIVGCRWAEAPISGMSWFHQTRNVSGGPVMLEFSIVQNGASISDECFPFAVPFIGYWWWRDEFGFIHLTEDWEDVAVFTPRMSLTTSILQVVVPLGILNVKRVFFPHEGQCGGARSFSSSTSSGANIASLDVTARNCY